MNVDKTKKEVSCQCFKKFSPSLTARQSKLECFDVSSFSGESNIFETSVQNLALPNSEEFKSKKLLGPSFNFKLVCFCYNYNWMV